MPLYDFRCIKCDNAFEEYSRYDERELVVCPVCQAPTEATISTFGGYKIKGNNSASVTPKGSGSKK